MERRVVLEDSDEKRKQTRINNNNNPKKKKKNNQGKMQDVGGDERGETDQNILFEKLIFLKKCTMAGVMFHYSI